MDIRTRHTQKRKGIRRWLLPHEMDERFTPAVAQAMREHKGTKEELWEKETRFHPELPQKGTAIWYMFFSFLHFLCETLLSTTTDWKEK